jgi:hypothetical protein
MVAWKTQETRAKQSGASGVGKCGACG